MTFAEVSREAVRQLNIDGKAEYRLRYKRNILDPSMQIRFAVSLVPNSCLDLVQYDDQISGSIMIKVVLQLPEGRLSSEHPLSRYIPDVLLVLQSSSPERLKVVKQSPNDSSLQIPVLNISGRNYHIEEWRGLRLCDLSDANGLLIRVHWETTKLSESEISSILLPRNTLDPVTEVNSYTVPVDSTQSSKDPKVETESPVCNSCEREFKFIESSQLSSQSLDEGMENFDISPLQAKQLVEEAKSRTRKLLDAPLMSARAVMAKQRADMIEKYPSTVIRVRLPDRRVVEATFDSTEQGSSVYSFVRRFNSNVNLLISAGKAVDPDAALVDQGLTPKAILTVHHDRSRN